MDRHALPLRDQAGPEEPRAVHGPIRVALAEEHDAMRRTLRHLLEHEPDFEVIADAADLETIVRDTGAQRPQVLVLDLSLSRGSSFRTIELMRELMPATEIVVVTMSDIPSIARRVFESGAIGYIHKEIADAELPRAVRRAARGEAHVGHDIAPA